MAHRTFGVFPGDVVTDSAGDIQVGVSLTVWTSRDRTTQVTSLFDLADVALPGYVTTDAQGRPAFRASDGYSALWLWDGDAAHDPWPTLGAEVFPAIDAAILQAADAVSIVDNGDGTLTFS